MGWQGLANISKVAPLTDEDLRVMRAIRELLIREGAENRFGVTLLHSHFDMTDDEILIETVNRQRRECTLQVLKTDAIPDGMALVPTAWRLDHDQNAIRPLQYCYRPKNSTVHMQ